LPIVTWVLTTWLGVAVFAWTFRRIQGDESSPLAAALAIGALVRGRSADEAALGGPPPAASALGGPAPAASAASVAFAGSGDPGSRESHASPPWRPAAAGTGQSLASHPSGSQSRPPLRFDAPGGADVDRRRITYRLVRLSDEPDNLRSEEILRLDRGDEVEILGEEAGFLHVRTPGGETGWIPRTAIIGQGSAAADG
jgi:hypothetical protein